MVDLSYKREGDKDNRQDGKKKGRKKGTNARLTSLGGVVVRHKKRNLVQLLHRQGI